MRMCSVCFSEEEKDEKYRFKYLPLYTIGSEGTIVCNACELILVNYIRSLREVAGRSKLVYIKEIKKKQSFV